MIHKHPLIFTKSLSKSLSRLYPESYSRSEILLSSFLFAAASYLFLIVFQPFGTYTFSSHHKYLLLVPYALISFVILSLTNLYFKKGVITWHLSTELLKIMLVLVVCSVLNYAYCIKFINKTGFSIYGLLYMALYTFTIGTPIAIIYFLSRYIHARSNYKYLPDLISEQQPDVNEPSNIIINSDAGIPALALSAAEFLFAESAGNYCAIYYLNDGIAKKQLIRLSLKSLEEQIHEETIVRCHRSFIVNTQRIVRSQGNAQGYKLQIEHSDTTVPVSRTYLSILNKP